MQHIHVLIQKFKEGLATPADLDLLETMLARQEDTSLKLKLRQEFDLAVIAGEKVLPPEKTAYILSTLHATIKRQEGFTSTLVRKRIHFAAAAAILVLVGYISARYLRNTNPYAVKVVTAINPKAKCIENNGNQIMVVSLQDGSVIKLAPGSRISYIDWADSNARCVTLHGKADFNVAANKHRPFTVYAGNIATTALGTAFTINAQEPQLVSIKLLSGKVVLHATNHTKMPNLYLLPGERFSFNNHTRQYHVEKLQPEATNRDQAVKVNTILMEFNNEPLNLVFQQLEAHFGTPIQYNHNDINEQYFTGQILKTDSLRNILSAICLLNNLEIAADESDITIRKAK